MRSLVLPVFAVGLVGAADEPQTQSALDNPAYSQPEAAWQSLPEIDNRAQECSDTMTKAQDASANKPQLEREPASAEKPHLIYAVDRRENGCSVMVMKGNPDDIRPLPAPAEGEMLQQIPASDDQ